MKKITILIVLLSTLTQMLTAQKVGLVLSGGGAKVAAHIGVIKAFEENGIPIDTSQEHLPEQSLVAYMPWDIPRKKW